MPGSPVVVPLKMPNGSSVGMLSCRYLPLMVSLGPNTWSILSISSRKLNRLRTEKLNLFGLPIVSGSLGRGSLLKMSLKYFFETGLGEVNFVPDRKRVVEG